MKVHWTLLSAFFIAVSYISITSGEKILVASFFGSRSHKNVYEPMLLELANRNHSLTVVSPYSFAKAHKNIREIIGPGEAYFKVIMPDHNFFESRLKGDKVNPFMFGEMFHKVCQAYYTLPELQPIFEEKFDLLILSPFMNECTYGLAHHFNTSFIFTAPFSTPSWAANFIGNPFPSSFIPLPFFGSSDSMNFKERLINFIASNFIGILMDWLYVPKLEVSYRDKFGVNTPGAAELAKNVSLILSNGHFTLNYPKPWMPDNVDVGGMHCRDAQHLPKDLEEFINGAEHGVIYFSLGSVVKAETMPESYRKMFVNAFSKLKQRVIWKWETEKMDDLPSNVKLGKWLPQQDILGKSNVKLFITHGGLLSTEEAVYHGVPLLGIPIFADQDWNMKQSESKGFALTLEFNNLTEEKIVAAIIRMLNDQTYTKTVKELSKVFKDRPEKPLDLALYWVEYVMRHKGAVHLRSPARELNWIQYHSIDVIATMFGTLALLSYIIYKVVRKVCCCVCSCLGLGCKSKTATNITQKKKKN